MTANRVPETEAKERTRVGATIREFREMRGLTPDQCATACGISRVYLVNIEAGRKPLTRILLARLAEQLNVRQASIVPAGYFAAEAEEVSA